MSDQILIEYRRVLTSYLQACIMTQASISGEIERIKEALAENLRFTPRYGLQDFANTIQSVTAQMHLFSQFTMRVED